MKVQNILAKKEFGYEDCNSALEELDGLLYSSEICQITAMEVNEYADSLEDELDTTSRDLLMTSILSIEQRTGYNFGVTPMDQSISDADITDSLEKAKDSFKDKAKRIGSKVWEKIKEILANLFRNAKKLVTYAKEVKGKLEGKDLNDIPASEMSNICGSTDFNKAVSNTIVLLNSVTKIKDIEKDNMVFPVGSHTIGRITMSASGEVTIDLKSSSTTDMDSKDILKSLDEIVKVGIMYQQATDNLKKLGSGSTFSDRLITEKLRAIFKGYVLKGAYRLVSSAKRSAIGANSK